MQLRTLGRSDLKVAPLAFGGNVFGWTADEATSFSLLDRFVDAGFNLIDTADVYSRWAPGHQGGESETIIGKWLKASGRRDRVVIATKVGMEMGPQQVGLAPDYMRRAVEASLKRLQTDVIDLYQSHRDDSTTPLADTLGAYAGLIEAGKVRFIGASNYSGERLEEAIALSESAGLPRYVALQPLYNLYDRDEFETRLRPVCARHDIGVISYYSLASGFLSGKYRSESDLKGSARGPGVKKYLTPRGMAILEALDEVAREYDASPTRIALAWLMAQPAVTAPIASATSLAQLEELIAAAELDLSAAALARLTAASTPQ